MHQHEPFFSFTVPTNEPSASETRSDDHSLLSISQKEDLGQTQVDQEIVTRIDHSTLTRSSPSGSVSPAALPGRPNTANQFAFNFPSASNTEVEERTPTAAADEVSPLPTAFATVAEPARRNSRHNLTIVTSANGKPNGRASFSGPVPPPSNTENINGQPESPAGYSNLDIGTHNTRPMTAPGAGWAGGNYNHGYDYTSASAGLFGNGGYHNSSGRTTANTKDGTNNTSSTVGEPKSSYNQTRPSLQSSIAINSASSRKSSLNQSMPTDQTQSNIASVPSHLTTPDRHPEPSQPERSMYHSASPTLHNLSDSTNISSPYLHPDASHHAFHAVRPNTHAGTSASFGERPGSSYGPPTPVHNGPSSPFTLASYSTTSRPGTANAASGLPIYGSSYQTSRPSTSYGTPRLNLPVSSQTPPSLTNASPVYGSVAMLSNVSDHTHTQIQPSNISTTTLNHSSPYGGSMGSHTLGSAGIGSDRMYNFSTLPVVPRKRARRRYDEIERLYSCSYPGCTKAYGTLNHLNAHITMQKHGPKRLPQEFKEIRKEWRARKKAEAEARSAPYKQAHQPQKNPNIHPHHQSHPHFQAHQNYRVLSNTSSPSALVGSDPNAGSNPLSLMGSHSSSASHYGNVPSGRPHPLMNGGPSPGGNLMNIGQAPMSRVLSTGALDSPTLTTSMMGAHPHGYGQDLLSPLPSSAPAYYASSHYAPPPLGSPAHAAYPPGLASAPRHSSMNYSNHLRPNSGLQLDRPHLQSSDGLRSVSAQPIPSRNGQDLKEMMNEEKKTNADTFLLTAGR